MDREIYTDIAAHVPDHILCEFIENKIWRAKEILAIQVHLLQCETCFEIFASVLQSERFPFTTEEKAEVERLLKDRNSEKSIKKVLNIIEKTR